MSIKKWAYYNEIDPFCVEWIKKLIEHRVITDGEVDNRSIEDVLPNELMGFRRVHMFAGIAGWDYSLNLAGWPDSQPVWTGSCPCQPFSAAGKGLGMLDERHLWPSWFHLISQCRPTTIFGEQVASKAVGPWFDLIQADLEGVGYAFGCVPFPAAGVGAPHLRDRAYWVADSSPELHYRAGSRGPGRRVEHPDSGGSERLADSGGEGLAGRKEQHARPERETTERNGDAVRPASQTNGMWRDADWLFCRDGKWRPVEPGTFPLAHGVSNRVGTLRGYGNAIVPAQAAEFIKAVYGC